MNKHAPKFFLFLIVIVLMVALYFAFQNSFLIPDPLVVQSASLSEDYLLDVTVCNPNTQHVSLHPDDSPDTQKTLSGSLTLYSGEQELSRYPFTIGSFDTSFGYEKAQSCGTIRIDLSKWRSLHRLSGDFTVLLTFHYSLNWFGRQSRSNMSLSIESNQSAIDLFISSSPSVVSLCSGVTSLSFEIQNIASSVLDPSESIDYQLVICDANDHTHCTMQRWYFSGFVDSSRSGHMQDLFLELPIDGMTPIVSGDLVYQLTVDPLGARNPQHSLNSVSWSLLRLCDDALPLDSEESDVMSWEHIWLTYRTRDYWFSLTFPEGRSGYLAETGTVTWWSSGKSDVVHFGLPSQNTLFTISMHRPNQRQTLQLLSDEKPAYLSESDRYVFGYTTADEVASNLIDRYDEIDSIVDSFALIDPR